MTKRKVFLMNCLILLCIHVQSILCESPNSDPVVGLGLLPPIARTVNHVITAPFRNQARLARNRARMRHGHLLRAENPLEDDGPVMIEQPTTKEESTKSNDQNADLRSSSGAKLKNNKRDEEYYLWSLNNWVPYGRTKERSADFIAIDNIYAYNKAVAEDPRPEVDVQLFANPNFYREYQVLPSDTEMKNIIPEFNGMDRFEGAPFIGINPKIFVMDNCGTEANQLSANHQAGYFVDPQNDFQSRFADPSDPRHFKIHHHSSSFKNWFSADKPTSSEPLMGWEYYKPPQIVINNHNQPLNLNKQNSQVAQTSGDNSISTQSQAVLKKPPQNWNIQVAETSGHSSTSQSQAVLPTDPRKELQIVNRNFQGAQTSHGSTALQSQAVTNEGASSLAVPQRLFAFNEHPNINTQAAKTFEGSTSNQVQTIEGGSGPNNQVALTAGGSQSTQTQTALPTNTNAQLFRLPSPYLVDVPPRGKPFIRRRYYRRRRSLPLVRLITDPNAKLDMPKTLENFGTVARNSFQDKRQPMYHMKNMVGSARDVFLSALRVPPQGIVIPSQYKIIDMKKEKAVPLNDGYTYLESAAGMLKGLPDEAKQFVEPVVGGTSVQKTPQSVKERIQERISNLRANLGPKVKSRSIFPDGSVRSLNTRSNNEEQFTETFQKMGNIFRESVKSGQQTLNHITDVAHSARKALTTATVGAPRVVRPLMQAPVFEMTKRKKKKIGKLRDDPEKVTFVAPRFLDVTNDGSRLRDTADGRFVDVGDIMNAFGVSNPAGDKVGLRRYVVHSKSAQDGPVVASRFKETNDIVKDGLPKKTYFVVAEDIEDSDLVANEIDVIEDLTDLLGGNSLQDLLSGIKDKVLANKYKELEDLQVKLQTLQEEERLGDKISSDEDIDQFIRSLFAASAPVNGEEQRLKRQINQQQHIHHHHNLALPANLLRPFMGSPSRIELNDYFRHYNDFEEVTDDRSASLTSEEMLQSQQDQFVEALLNPSEYISAINPKMYLKLFNEPLAYQKKYPQLDGKKVKDMVENHNMDVVGGSKRADEEERNENERINMKVKDKLLRPFMGLKDKGFYESHVDYVPNFGYLPGYYVGHHQNNGYHD